MSADLIAATDSLTASIDALTAALTFVFSIPESADFATLYAYGLTLPVVCYLTAWSARKLNKLFEEK